MEFKWKIVGKNSNSIYEDSFVDKNRKYFVAIKNIINFDEKYFPSYELISYYKKSHIYLNLSRIESFGITFIESLASGVPIVSFASKGANELILNNKNGYLVNNYNINKIVDIFKKLRKKKLNLKN